MSYTTYVTVVIKLHLVIMKQHIKQITTRINKITNNYKCMNTNENMSIIEILLNYNYLEKHIIYSLFVLFLLFAMIKFLK